VKLSVKSLDVAVAGPLERAWELGWMRQLHWTGLRLRHRGHWRRLGAGGDGAGCSAAGVSGSVAAVGSTLSDVLGG
jgi:hypothetical protein